jgi:hypothetical protein
MSTAASRDPIAGVCPDCGGITNERDGEPYCLDCYWQPLPSACEHHDVAGECDEECLALVQAMSTDYSEPMIYGDYLGGTSSIDWSGCHAPEPRVERIAVLDPVRRAVVWEERCPYEDEHDACDCTVCDYLGM